MSKCSYLSVQDAALENEGCHGVWTVSDQWRIQGVLRVLEHPPQL